MNKTRQALLQDGAALFENALPDPTFLARLREFALQETAPYVMGPLDRDAKAAPVYPWLPLYREVVERGAEILGSLGFEDIKIHSGALIPKWPGEGRRGWHVDMFTWEDSVDNWREIPPQIGILFYVDDATPDTGALIIAPQSHRRELPGHHESWESWDARTDEKVIPAKAGDAVLLDPRCMHAVTPNTTTDKIRFCLTLWFMVDWAKLEDRTKATVLLSVMPEFSQLGPLCPTYEGPAKYFPHCKKPQFPIDIDRIDALRNGRTSPEIIGAAAYPNDLFLSLTDTYSWYFGIGAAKAPSRILEFGVRYGYSALAMAKGAQWAGKWPSFVGVDLEADGVASNAVALANLEAADIPARIFKVDTKDVTATASAVNGTGCPDIAHIDGDHSPEGIAAEIAVARLFIQPYGLILIDDVDAPHVKAAADILCEDLGITPIVLPTLHGLYVIDMRRRTRYGK